MARHEKDRVAAPAILRLQRGRETVVRRDLGFPGQHVRASSPREAIPGGSPCRRKSTTPDHGRHSRQTISYRVGSVPEPPLMRRHSHGSSPYGGPLMAPTTLPSAVLSLLATLEFIFRRPGRL